MPASPQQFEDEVLRDHDRPYRIYAPQARGWPGRFTSKPCEFPYLVDEAPAAVVQ